MELLGQFWQSFVEAKPWEWILSGVGLPILGWLLFRSRKNTTSSQKETDNDLSVCPPRLRQQLLKRFRNDLDLRLSSLLDERTPLDLEKKLSPHEVDRPHSLRDILYEQEGRAPQVTDLSIIDIFQDKESGERLAILGKPGSGKTISLLQLHDHLLKRAEEEEQESLPVIFECSEWDDKDLVDWMGRQLSKNYRGLQEELAKELVRDEVIFPLFDGLDELLQSRQDKFVQAFNKFQTGRSLVVCCRLEEYRRLQKKVDLNHAVILQDISEKKLEGYLKRLQLYGLWIFLQQSQKQGKKSSLFELARRPLFLNIMLTLENERSLSQDEGLRRGKQAENRLWELYLDYCLKKKTPSKKNGSEKYWKQYSKDHSIRWLYCLANRIKTEGKVEFRLDELHPDCLYHIWKFKVSYGLLSGIPLGLIIMSFLNSAFGLRIIPLWMAYVLLRDEQVVKQDEIIRLGYPSTLYDWKKVLSGLLEGIIFGLIIGGLVGLIAFGSLAYGLSCVVIFALIRASRNLNVSIPETVSPYQTLFYAGLNGCFLVPLTSLTAAFVYFKAIESAKYTGCQIVNNMQEPSVYAVFFLMLFVSIVSYGSITIIRHYLVRLFLWQEDQLPLRLINWLEFLHHRKILQRVGGSYHFIHKQLLEYLARTHSVQQKPDS